MTANILEVNGQHAFTELNINSLRVSAWHGLGNCKPYPRTAEESLGDLPFVPVAEGAPVGYYIGGEWHPYGGKKAVYGVFPKDERREYGIVDVSYPILQHHEFAQAWDAGTKLPIATSGILAPGARMFLCGALRAVSVKGDIVDAYLSALNDQSGSGGNVLNISTVRVVCQNTLSLALGDGSFAARVNIMHKGMTPDQLLGLMQDEFTGIVTRANAAVNDFEHKANVLAEKRISEEQAAEIFRSAFITPRRPRTNAANNDVVKARAASWEAAALKVDSDRDLCMDLYKSGGQTMQGIAGTAWGAVNAVTEYVDHVMPERGDLQKVSAAKVFGYKGVIKSRAWGAALAMK